MRRRRGVVAALIVFVCAGGAHADSPHHGLYVTASGGVNLLGDRTLDASIDGVSGSGGASFSESFLTAFAVGYRFANNWSIEEEVAFRRVSLSSADLSPIGAFSDGDFANTQLSARALYHIPVRNRRDLEAYVGAGIAWLAELDFDLESGGVEQPFEDDVLGLELHAGFRYFGWPRAFVGGGLRYLTVRDTDLPAPSNANNVVRTDYDPLSVVLEFGWRF